MSQYKLVTIDPDREGQHPLRSVLTAEDWQRIQAAIDGSGKEDTVTLDEIEAAQDVFYDAVVARLQTHPGTTVLQ